MLLCAHKLFLEVVENSLTEFIVSRVLCQFGELKVIVDVIRLVNHQVSYVETLLPLLKILGGLEF